MQLDDPKTWSAPGQECAYRALQVAAEGGYRVLFVGGVEAELLAADAPDCGVEAEAVRPCPCGNFGDSNRECRCTPGEVRDYRRRRRDLFAAADMVIDAPRTPFRCLADKRYCDWLKGLDEDMLLLLEKAYDSLGLDIGQLRKVVAIARTVANLAGAERIRIEHVSEAIQYVGGFRQWIA